MPPIIARPPTRALCERAANDARYRYLSPRVSEVLDNSLALKPFAKGTCAQVAEPSALLLSDEELLVAARYNNACFAQLYLRYAERLYRYALGRARSASVADDIVGDTVLAALESLERFDPERGSAASWLFTIASRRLADHERRRARFRRFLTRHALPPPAQADPHEASERNERAERVRAAVAELPPRQQEIVLLRHVAELPIHDVARVLVISEGAVKMRLQRALRRMALELGEPDAD